jgi:hypothetical protein
MKKLFFVTLFIVFGLFVSSWGYRGHEKIAEKSGQYFKWSMKPFKSWVPYLIEHSPDPDRRKKLDKSEAAKHYIDLDSFPEYLIYKSIPQQLDTLIARHSETFVLEQGILPWATLTAYDSLVSCFKRLDMAKAKLFAADLCHYVADGHMPLHLTSNYNGQNTGNEGIHGRYESEMINRFLDEINFKSKRLKKIENRENYIFGYIYWATPYIDSILVADIYAKTIDADTKSTAYTDALWSRTKPFTIELFSNASHHFAELIYNAWNDAGCPRIVNGKANREVYSEKNTAQ